jgi:hypothetical protein
MEIKMFLLYVDGDFAGLFRSLQDAMASAKFSEASYNIYFKREKQPLMLVASSHR